ncbi:hypothetical protein ACFWCB_34540 [Streptomyces sp. NPDC060048]|uniref:hypothetical protein n=1 Tax=unclassified Streptomyces TaxID=2593676 RepID=UPI0036750B68
MSDAKFRIKIKAADGSPFTVMFEPTGMTYDLEADQVMFAEVQEDVSTEIEIVYWGDGISVWPQGPVTTYDADGNELHELN